MTPKGPTSTCAFDSSATLLVSPLARRRCRRRRRRREKKGANQQPTSTKTSESDQNQTARICQVRRAREVDQARRAVQAASIGSGSKQLSMDLVREYEREVILDIGRPSAHHRTVIVPCS